MSITTSRWKDGRSDTGERPIPQFREVDWLKSSLIVHSRRRESRRLDDGGKRGYPLADQTPRRLALGIRWDRRTGLIRDHPFRSSVPQAASYPRRTPRRSRQRSPPPTQVGGRAEPPSTRRPGHSPHIPWRSRFSGPEPVQNRERRGQCQRPRSCCTLQEAVNVQVVVDVVDQNRGGDAQRQFQCWPGDRRRLGGGRRRSRCSCWRRSPSGAPRLAPADTGLTVNIGVSIRQADSTTQVRSKTLRSQDPKQRSHYQDCRVDDRRWEQSRSVGTWRDDVRAWEKH